MTGIDQFFRTGRLYAVAGASSNPSKYGYKVLQWYRDRDLPVVPINPRKETILGVQSVESIQEVDPSGRKDIGLSVITPPAISLDLVDQISKLNGAVKAIWFQPGSFNKEVLDRAKTAGIPVIIAHGDCILVQGDDFLPKL